jgi:hypothetical protein
MKLVGQDLATSTSQSIVITTDQSTRKNTTDDPVLRAWKVFDRGKKRRLATSAEKAHRRSAHVSTVMMTAVIGVAEKVVRSIEISIKGGIIAQTHEAAQAAETIENWTSVGKKP